MLKSTDFVTFMQYGGQSLTVRLDDVISIYPDTVDPSASYVQIASAGAMPMRIDGSSDDNRVRLFAALSTRETSLN